MDYEDDDDATSNTNSEISVDFGENSIENGSASDCDRENDAENGMAGWADAFAKVLQQEKPKSKKYLVLSKAKKLSERVEKDDANKKLTFEITEKDDNNDDIKPDVCVEDEKPTNDQLALAMLERKERNNKLQQLRVKPDSMDHERERSFKRIATKGVVQLFNAVRAQQRDLLDQLEKAGPLDHKRDAVLNNINKRQFLDMLMGGKRAKSENVDNAIKNEKEMEEDSSKPSTWSVLRDDFMTNKKLKHWDDIGDQTANMDSVTDSD